MITTQDVPATLKTDRDVTPYIARSLEIHNVNPVVSYYCKVYVLDHILYNKLHVGNPEVEKFTIALLDETEATKNSTDDDDLHKALADRQISANLVLAFGLRLFQSSLEDLSNYDGSNQVQIGSKLRAAINFLSVLKIFDDDSGEVDFGKITGGKCTTKDEFTKFYKEKVKTLKYQLSRLVKNEIPIKGEEEELAKLEEEASRLDQGEPNLETDTEKETDVEDSKSNLFQRAADDSKARAELSTPDSAAAFDDLGLPGAPKYDPEDENEDVKLPGAPKFLPDDDAPIISRQLSIQVFQPEDLHKETTAPKPTIAPKPVRRVSLSTKPHVSLTKETLTSIIDTTEHISQAQKHAKFAISALNYEDLDTAEKELLKGLELLRLVREADSK